MKEKNGVSKEAFFERSLEKKLDQALNSQSNLNPLRLANPWKKIIIKASIDVKILKIQMKNAEKPILLKTKCLDLV